MKEKADWNELIGAIKFISIMRTSMANVHMSTISDAKIKATTAKNSNIYDTPKNGKLHYLGKHYLER